jgi:hypothetical protein
MAAQGPAKTAKLVEEENGREYVHSQEEEEEEQQQQKEEEQVQRYRCQHCMAVEAIPRIPTGPTGSRHLLPRHYPPTAFRRSIRDSIPRHHMCKTPRRCEGIDHSSDQRPSTGYLALVPTRAATPARLLGPLAGLTIPMHHRPLHFRTRRSRCWGSGRPPPASVCLRRQNHATI